MKFDPTTGEQIVQIDGTSPTPPPVGGAAFATNQVTVTTSATQLAAAAPTQVSLTVVNGGTADVYIGDAAVTTGTGVLLVGVKGAAVTIPTTAAVYGTVASGTTLVSLLEVTR